MGMICNLLRVTSAELKAYKQDSNLLAERIKDKPEEDSRYDIDRAWDGIIFLLTGKNSSDTTHPLSRIIFSGQYIDKTQNLGYAPASYLNPVEVAKINAEISTINPADLKPKFLPAAMKEEGVYPNAWEQDETLDYLLEYFETVQEVYAVASQNGEGIVTFIN